MAFSYPNNDNVLTPHLKLIRFLLKTRRCGSVYLDVDVLGVCVRDPK